MFLPGPPAARCNGCLTCGIESSESKCFNCGRLMNTTTPSTVINAHRWAPTADTPPGDPMGDWTSVDWWGLYLLTNTWSSSGPTSVDAVDHVLYGESGLA